MKITAIDESNDLFFVEDIFPNELIEKILQQDYMTYSWEIQEGQESWHRRKLKINNTSPLAKIDPYLNAVRNSIADTIGVVWNEYDCWSSFWLDMPRFTTDIHLDGYLPSAMQIYLGKNIKSIGTTFYKDYAVPLQIRHQFDYEINTGYLMLNNSKQWHGMLNPVPDNSLRLSCYTYFGTFSHK